MVHLRVRTDEIHSFHTSSVYIVYMGAVRNGEYSPSAHHTSILQEVVGGSFAEQYLVRSYTKSLNAFAAKLTEQEYQKLAAHEEVVSIFPSTTLQLQTTESWDFTGFPLNVSRSSTNESDVIIGVMDSGIWPESKSFNDHGLGPVPKKWKGVCDGGKNFTCNRKIIGARHYDVGDSARDLAGHGSHIASIAAGNIVTNKSFYGLAQGTVRGGVPSARIAVYKVCLFSACSGQDVLAAFDDAIADGIDILTVPLTVQQPSPFQDEVISIGSFHAAEKGILTVNSAGNSVYGPTPSVVPWLFTVAASSTKRKIISKVSSGNGKEWDGIAINSFKLNGTNFPVVYGDEATSANCSGAFAALCDPSCLEKKKVEGKILMCSGATGILGASTTGALGAIGQLDESIGPDNAYVFPCAASVITTDQFMELESYYNSTKNPRAIILPSEITENKIAPIVASFSARGPNLILPDILKPDITAPGVDILAAYSPAASPSLDPTDKRSVEYSFVSGTSIACAHVAGAAAYVKSWHPDWSPSAIKSALMTTAWPMNASNTLHRDKEFSYGAGHFDPVKALNPGLVYETLKEDYVAMICSMGFDNQTLRKIFGDNTTACTQANTSLPRDLNYPSMSALIKRDLWIAFPRTVTNVGLANSTYKAIITSPRRCNITVEPSILSFQALNERKSFIVNTTFLPERASAFIISASLEWTDGVHSVRSPIVL